MKPEIKKLLILNLPYLLFVYLFDKAGAAVRLSPGMDASQKILNLGEGFTAAFASAAPSFHPADVLIGIAGAVIIRLAVYLKGKNAKKCAACGFPQWRIRRSRRALPTSKTGGTMTRSMLPHDAAQKPTGSLVSMRRAFSPACMTRP